jgi:hypothetical protein
VRTVRHARPMDDALPPVDIEALVGEIERYLAAVDAFREADCEPRWRRERRPVHIAAKETSG